MCFKNVFSRSFVDLPFAIKFMTYFKLIFVWHEVEVKVHFYSIRTFSIPVPFLENSFSAFVKNQAIRYGFTSRFV